MQYPPASHTEFQTGSRQPIFGYSPIALSLSRSIALSLIALSLNRSVAHRSIALSLIAQSLIA
ncbi:MAG: hypothetical protein ABR582_17085, partial [Gemmatimonadaceae bacterium]